MKGTFKGIIKKAGPKTFTLALLGAILSIIFIVWSIAEISRPPDLSSLSPEDYADNPDLYKFVKGLVDPDEDSKVLWDMSELDYSARIMNDKRYVDILILCLHEKETIPHKLMRFLSIMSEYVELYDLSWITDLWDELIYIFEEDEKSWIRDQAIAYLAVLEEKAFPAVPEICRILKEDSISDVRYCALYALEEIKSPEAFPHIVSLIDDKEIMIEDFATSLAASAREKQQVLTIVNYLDNENERFRLLGVSTLLYIPYLDKDLSKKVYEKARMMLIHDPSIDVRIECLHLLNQLEEEELTCKILLLALEKEKNSYMIQALIEGLAYYEKAAEYLIEVVKGENESEIQLAAIHSLGTLLNSNKKLNQEISDLYVNLIKSPNTLDSIRKECMKQLAGSKSQGSEELIFNWMKKKYREKVFSENEINQLTRIKDEKVIEFLLSVLDEQAKPRDQFMQIDDIVCLIEKMGEYHSEKVNKRLKQFLKDSSFGDKKIKNVLLEVLAKNNDEEAVLHVLKKLKGNDLENYEKWELLKKLKDCQLEAFMKYLANYLNARVDTYHFYTIFNSFYISDERVYKEILEIVNDENIEVGLRCEAIEGLRRTFLSESTTEIKRIMGDEKMPVLIRLKAAEALSSTDHDKSILFVAECLNHENLKVRRKALEGIWAFDEKKVLPILQRRAKNENNYNLKNEIANWVAEIKEDLRLEKAAEDERKELEKGLEKE